MAKLTDTQMIALNTLNRDSYAVISTGSEKALIRLGLIHPTFSTITLKGRVTLANEGRVPSNKEWELAELVLRISADMAP